MIRRPLRFAFLLVRFLTPASVDANDWSVNDEDFLCDVTFTLETEHRTSGFVFEAAYDGASVDPLGAADAVFCTTLVQNGLGAYNDEEETQTLVGALVHIAGVEGTVDVAKCRFAAPEGLTAEQLSVSVHDAVAPDGYGLPSLPAVFVGDVVCGTAEELDEDGGNGGGGGGEDCSGDYEVTFGVAGNSVLGALQLSIAYTGAPGSFAGTAGAADCKAEVAALSMFNDIDDHKTLKAGLMTTAGFATPADVVTCRFESTGREPVVSDFLVEVEDVAFTSGEDVIPAPAAFVASIVAKSGGCGGEPVCGNGVVEDGEECDEGGNNGAEGSACQLDCTSVTGCGDSDGNGVVSASDAARVLSEAVGLGVDCSLSRCDVNGTGSVTATDARMVLDVSVGRDVALSCESGLVVSLDDDVTLGGLELIVDYSAGNSAVVGDDEDVACTSLVDGALVSFNNDRGAKQLRAAIVALPAIDGPTPLVACAIDTGAGGGTDDDFVVQVLDAIAPDLSTVEDPAVTASW
jgi:hypothetical protein